MRIRYEVAPNVGQVRNVVQAPDHPLVALRADRSEGYVRLSITVPDDRLDEGVRRIESLAGSWR